MASVGEGAARGLESGFRLAMDIHERQRQGLRQDAQDARQITLDQRAQEDHARAIARQDDAQALNALGAQHTEHAARLQAISDSGRTPDEREQQELTATGEGINQKRAALLGKMGGYDPAVVKQEAAQATQALEKGDMDYLAKTPGALTKAITVAGGHAPAAYKRGQNGEPAPIELASKDLMEGLEGGDQDRIVNGANVIFGPDLQKGIGGKGAQGGTIVGKRIVNMVPDPHSPKDDPHVIPTVRVYVNNGKKEASGDEIRMRREMDPDAPPGSTGHYDAPLTQNRSSDPNDPTKSISIKAALDKVGKHMHLVELLNTPEADQLLQADAQSGWDPVRYQQVRAAYGTKEPKPTVTEKIIPRGATLLRTTTTKGGLSTEERIEGNAARLTPLEEAQQYVDEHPGTSLAAARALVSPSRAANAAAGLSGGEDGEGDGPVGLTPAQKRMYDVGNKALENRSNTLDRKEQRERDDYKNDLDEVKPDPMGDLAKVTAEKVKRRAEIRAEHAKVVATHDAEREEIKTARLLLETNSQGAKPANAPGVERGDRASDGKSTPAADTAESRAALLKDVGGIAKAPAELKIIRDFANKATNPDTKRIATEHGDRLEAAIKVASSAPAEAPTATPRKAGTLTKDAAAAKFGF